MASISSRRLAKELHEIKTEGCPVGMQPDILIVPDSNAEGHGYVGINLLQAEDFAAWQFTIEVMGESLYQVRFRIYRLGWRIDRYSDLSSRAKFSLCFSGSISTTQYHLQLSSLLSPMERPRPCTRWVSTFAPC